MFCLSAFWGKEKQWANYKYNNGLESYKYMCEEYREYIKAKKAKINSISPEIDLKTHSSSRAVIHTA